MILLLGIGLLWAVAVGGASAGTPPPTEPFRSSLTTRWGEAVTAENAWTEYPRPMLRRDRWRGLNGLWDYAVTPDTQRAPPAEWSGKILVPFPLESRLSGVGRLLHGDEALWYRRRIEVDRLLPGRRVLLNFEAVDYECEVRVNGKKIGAHRGGATPFSLDATDALRPGDNELIVRALDSTNGYQLRGKQTLRPGGIWYTRVSGIWQSVWMEEVPSPHLTDINIRTDANAGSISVGVEATSDAAEFVVRVLDGDREVARDRVGAAATLTVTVPEPKLWSPESPFLYGLQVRLLDGDGGIVDEAESYAGIRTVGKARDAQGHLRMTLNGEPYFHWGTLDQGWWPDGLLAPPSDEAMRHDIVVLKSAGFNMIRKHIKIEPRRYYAHCDRLGMLVWQDQPSGGRGPEWTRLRNHPADARWPDREHEQFMHELAEMINHLDSHPSIAVWAPFNEAWGQHRTMRVGRWVARRDPTRLLNIASGGNFWPVGDIVDAHNYPHPSFPFAQGAGGRFDDYVKVVGEFGGHGFPAPGHTWDPTRGNWGYGGFPESIDELTERYAESIDRLIELKRRGIAGGVYTQTTDVEGEVNGLMTYDRRVVKIPVERLARLHKRLLADAPPPTAAGRAE